MQDSKLNLKYLFHHKQVWKCKFADQVCGQTRKEKTGGFLKAKQTASRLRRRMKMTTYNNDDDYIFITIYEYYI